MVFATANDGKLLENLVHQALRGYCQKHAAVYHRFYDTRSARNPLPAQPGDFLFIAQGKAFLLECKSTVVSTRIRTLAKRSPEQIGKHKLWIRAGGFSRYIYLDIIKNSLVLLDGEDILDNARIIAPLFCGGQEDMEELISSIPKKQG